MLRIQYYTPCKPEDDNQNVKIESSTGFLKDPPYQDEQSIAHRKTNQHTPPENDSSYYSPYAKIT